MQLKETTKIALRINSVFIFIMAVILGYFYYLQLLPLWVSIVILSISGLFSFFTTKLYIEKYIYNKIKIIYKIIKDHKVAKAKKTENKKKLKDSIESVHQEVLDWSQDYEKEISHLKDLEEYRREYIGNISHELKTPLFTILGYISTLIDGGLSDDTINLKYLERSEKNINRLINIVKELETINQLESGEIKIEKTRFNIVDLVNETFESLEMKAKSKEIKLYYGKKYDRPIYTFADRSQIQKLITNLIENAIKYGFKSNGKVKVSFFDMDDKILIEVTDNGPGISKDDLPRIFERFYRTDKARNRKLGGTGLGLAIVKHILEAHKQTIYTRSTIGIGTTFGFTLEKS